MIVFNRPGEKTYIIHRVIATETLANGTIRFKTKGDANPTEDPWILEQNVKGRVLHRIPYTGYMALIPAIPITIAILIIIIILLWPEKTKRFHHKLYQAKRVDEGWRLGVRASRYFAEATANGRLSLNNAYKKTLKLCFPPWAT